MKNTRRRRGQLGPGLAHPAQVRQVQMETESTGGAEEWGQPGPTGWRRDISKGRYMQRTGA